MKKRKSVSFAPDVVEPRETKRRKLNPGLPSSSNKQAEKDMRYYRKTARAFWKGMLKPGRPAHGRSKDIYISVEDYTSNIASVFPSGRAEVFAQLCGIGKFFYYKIRGVNFQGGEGAIEKLTAQAEKNGCIMLFYPRPLDEAKLNAYRIELATKYEVPDFLDPKAEGLVKPEDNRFDSNGIKEFMKSI